MSSRTIPQDGVAIPYGFRECLGDCHASVLCSALRAAFGGCALHAPAGVVARNDILLFCYSYKLQFTEVAAVERNQDAFVQHLRS